MRDSAAVRIVELESALKSYLDAGLVLQRIIGKKFTGPELERLGILMEWQTACLRHGQAKEVLG